VDPQLPFDELVATKAGCNDVPDSWSQGRGAFGGYVTGVMVRALEDSAPDRPLRSLTAELCGPLVAGRTNVDLTVLRAGNAVTTTAIRLSQHGEVQAHGVGVLGRTRTSDHDRTTILPPCFAPWREVVPAPHSGVFAPSFMQHFELRILRGVPFGGATEPLVEGWVRPKRPGQRRDAAYLAACIDCYYPCLYAIEKTARPMATIAFTFQPFEFSGDPDAPLAYRARMIAASDGYCVEFRELWSEDGHLVALNQQTMVIIK
jgi:acyl-CoA thioesterase